MRKALPYRPVATLAALALLLSAFAPAPFLPCAPAVDAPAQEDAPCHGMAGGGMEGHRDAPEAPSAPRTPALPQPDMACCPTKAPLAPTPEQPAPVALAVVEVLDVLAVLAPASQPHPVQATDASPPTPVPLHLLFGRFLT
jgi:hypothetical protein